jgi:hypothetical protein
VIPIVDYIEARKITFDAIEGLAIGSNKPRLNELCTFEFSKRVEVFRCVYFDKVKRGKYWCRFERANWK